MAALKNFAEKPGAPHSQWYVGAMEYLVGVVQELSHARDVNAIMTIVRRAARALTGADGATFVLREGDMCLYADEDAIGPLWKGQRFPLHGCISGWSILNGQSVMIPDIYADPRVPADAYRATFIKSLAMVPIRKGNPIGAIGAYWAEPHEAGEEEISVLQALADTTSVAMENAESFARERAARLAAESLNKALRESEQRYRLLIQSLPAAAYICDADGYIQLYNDAAAALWGREPVTGQDKWCGSVRMFQGDGAALPLEESPMAVALREARSVRGREVVIERRDGVRRDILPHPTPLFDGEGRSIGAINMLVDITDRKKVEVALAAQVETLERLHELSTRLSGSLALEEGLQAILETLADVHGAQFGLLSVYDPATHRLMKAAQTGFDAALEPFLSSYEPVSGVGTGGIAFHTKQRKIVEDVETDPCYAQYLDFARNTGFRSVHSTPVLTRDGDLLGVLTVYFKETHVPTALETRLADICARHAADVIETHSNQQALRESERLYRAIGESIDYGVWVCDADGRNTYASESFLKLVGLTQPAFSAGWRDVLHPEDVGDTLEQWQECARTGRIWDKENRFRGVDGKWHPVLARGVPVRDDAGGIICWAGINLDISRLKESEAALKETDRRKDEFLAMLAHELRNPLAPLRNALHILGGDGVDPALQGQMRALMERQVNHMVRLVDDLMDVSRISRNRVELRRERLDFSEAIRNAVETAQPLIDKAGHTLSISLPASPVYINGDLIRLSQVFSNLLNNAAKYTRPGGRISLEAAMSGGEVVVRIQDTGIGIAPEMLARIFDLFLQADNSLSRETGGLGIGLTLVKRLVEKHGGRVTAKSAGADAGSTFTVWLPVLEAEPHVPAAAPAAEGAPAAPLRVLVVDDNEASAKTLGWTLELLGHHVTLAHNGPEALRLAPPLSLDLVLLDIGLPGMSGYDVCRALRAMPGFEKTVFAAQTGWGQEEHRRMSREAGFRHHLVKPVNIATLQSVLSSVGGGRGLRTRAPL